MSFDLISKPGLEPNSDASETASLRMLSDSMVAVARDMRWRGEGDPEPFGLGCAPPAVEYKLGSHREFSFGQDNAKATVIGMDVNRLSAALEAVPESARRLRSRMGELTTNIRKGDWAKVSKIVNETIEGNNTQVTIGLNSEAQPELYIATERNALKVEFNLRLENNLFATASAMTAPQLGIGLHREFDLARHPDYSIVGKVSTASLADSAGFDMMAQQRQMQRDGKLDSLVARRVSEWMANNASSDQIAAEISKEVGRTVTVTNGTTSDNKPNVTVSYAVGSTEVETTIILEKRKSTSKPTPAPIAPPTEPPAPIVSPPVEPGSGELSSWMPTADTAGNIVAGGMAVALMAFRSKNLLALAAVGAVSKAAVSRMAGERGQVFDDLRSGAVIGVSMGIGVRAAEATSRATATRLGFSLYEGGGPIARAGKFAAGDMIAGNVAMMIAVPANDFLDGKINSYEDLWQSSLRSARTGVAVGGGLGLARYAWYARLL